MPVQLDKHELRELVDNRQQVRRENIDHYLTHEDELREQYGGRTIAIANKQVVDSTDETDIGELRVFIDHVQTEYNGAYITAVPEPGQSMLY
ncbi:hypothetical protein BRC87_00435 [Halobacteriales archaeon QS_4_66_20]|nr:MAG: hypothetical protein BRC87_00435 [Halobacteriales archaeon QS_4_66_20]